MSKTVIDINFFGFFNKIGAFLKESILERFNNFVNELRTSL